VPVLRTREWHVIGCGRRSEAPPWLVADSYLSIDAISSGAVSDVVERLRPNAIVNLVGLARGSASELCRANVTSGVNMLLAAVRHAPRSRVLFVGSAAEYGPVPEHELPISEEVPCAPTAAYGITKLALTETALWTSSGTQLRVHVVRPFNMVGAGAPTSQLVGALVERVYHAIHARHSEPITIGRTDTLRDFIAVEDVAEAMVRLLDGEAAPGIYNLCSGHAVPVEQLLRMLREICGHHFEWRTDPTLVRPDDVLISRGTAAKAAAAIGFAPAISLQQSLTAAWRDRILRADSATSGQTTSLTTGKHR
jgi:GDP-4-dehydro-6-deoxy-D-mannose reductase